jgi:hypothetical protein
MELSRLLSMGIIWGDRCLRCCPTYDRPTDLDLQILDLLREDAKSAGRLAEVLTHGGERVNPEAVRLRLRALARRGLVVVGSPTNPRADAGVGGSA